MILPLVDDTVLPDLSSAMSNSERILSSDELIDWLRLIRSDGVGAITFFQLLARFESASAALDALPELAKRGGGKRLRLVARDTAIEELEKSADKGIDAIGFVDPRYPSALRAIADPPPILFVHGRIGILRNDGVAIVGARNASASGARFARQLAHDIGAEGFNIVSGMARGIDSAAHSGAIVSGTVAVLAGGADVVYPPENEKLYQNILENGAIVSEMAVGTVATARHFPRRNRLISGLSLGVVVVEAAPRSGSLITARLAGEQGREVFAVPGSPLDPRARGTNALIRQGAQLTEGADDVLEGLKRMRERRVEETPEISFDGLVPTPVNGPNSGQERSKVTDLLGPTPIEVDELIRQSELTAPEVITILLELDLAGRLDRHPGNRVSFR